MILSWGNNLHRIPPKVFQHHFFYKGPWFPGYISNFRQARQQGSFWFKKGFFPEQPKRSKASIAKLILAELGIIKFPNLLFVYRY